MEQRPEQPPEGRLIADAADRMNLSIREAARRAGISYGRWRQIVTGYQNVSPGNFAAVHAPARTLARMAQVVGLTPEQMESQGGRPDAAEAMRDSRQEAQPARYEAPPGFPPATREQLTDMVEYLDEIHLRLELALRKNPGGALTGTAVFPTSPADASLWDELIRLGPSWPPEGVAWMWAASRAWDSQEAAEAARKGRATG